MCVVQLRECMCNVSVVRIIKYVRAERDITFVCDWSYVCACNDIVRIKAFIADTGSMSCERDSYFE